MNLRGWLGGLVSGKKDINLMSDECRDCTKAAGRVSVPPCDIMYLVLVGTIEREGVWL